MPRGTRMPDGTTCYRGVTCRVHGPQLAAARAADERASFIQQAMTEILADETNRTGRLTEAERTEMAELRARWQLVEREGVELDARQQVLRQEARHLSGQVAQYMDKKWTAAPQVDYVAKGDYMGLLDLAHDAYRSTAARDHLRAYVTSWSPHLRPEGTEPITGLPHLELTVRGHQASTAERHALGDRLTAYSRLRAEHALHASHVATRLTNDINPPETNVEDRATYLRVGTYNVELKGIAYLAVYPDGTAQRMNTRHHQDTWVDATRRPVTSVLSDLYAGKVYPNDYLGEYDTDLDEEEPYDDENRYTYGEEQQDYYD